MSIVLNNVNKSFLLDGDCSIKDMIRGRINKIEVLHNINLSVDNGEICGILGKNGAGKSTLLRVAGGIYSYEGIIKIEGEISSIFELGAVLNRNQTGRNYCRDYFLFTMKENNPKKVQELSEDIKEFTELGDYFDRPVRTYSSGMLAKLLFGVATAISADAVLIDEALVVGDAGFQEKARRRLLKMLGAGTAGIVVSHDWTSLLRLCTVGAVMDRGKIIMQGDIRDCIKSYVGFSTLNANQICIRKKNELHGKKCFWTDCGEFEFDIGVNVIPQNRILEVNIMIEKYNREEGWDIVYTNGASFTVSKTGIYHIKALFPELKLCDGDYMLGIHLSDKIYGETNNSIKTYDRMQWLEHSEICVKVENVVTSSAVFKEKIKWKKKILQE